MITENLSTLKINTMTQAQYERELEAGRISPNELYLTPDKEIDLSGYAVKEHTHVTADGGFNGGEASSASVGAAVGKESVATFGGSAGYKTQTEWGGSVGYNAISTNGFSGGYYAKATVNAIQLGAGTNTEEKSLQVYDKQLMNGNGMIPFARYAKFVQGTTAQNLASGTIANNHTVYAESEAPSVNPGSVIVVPIMRCAFNLVATVRYDKGSVIIQVTRPVGMAENSAITGYYLDYWIFSEKPI